MHNHPRTLLLPLLCAILAGCGTTLPTMTESFKSGLSEEEIQNLSFFVSAEITFRSVRELENFNDEGPFKRDRRRTLSLQKEKPGRAIGSGEGWVTVDFGDEIVLQFRRNQVNGTYSTPGWGTTTIRGERYDIMVGVMSGQEVRLLYGLPKR